MPSVPAGACLGQSLATARRQRERVVQFAISEQSAIGGDHRTAEPKNQAAVETEPQRAPVRFTRRVRHHRPFDLAQHVVYYTIIRTIAPQNTVSSEESGLMCRSGARSAVPTGLAGYFHIFLSFAKKIPAQGCRDFRKTPRVTTTPAPSRARSSRISLVGRGVVVTAQRGRMPRRSPNIKLSHASGRR